MTFYVSILCYDFIDYSINLSKFVVEVFLKVFSTEEQKLQKAGIA